LSFQNGTTKSTESSLPTVGPIGRAGPLNFTGFLDLNITPYIPVNADDENGSTVTNGIPAKRDFEVMNIAGPTGSGDLDLQLGKLNCADNAGGVWTQQITQNGQGKIDLWTDSHKITHFFPTGNGVIYFFVEGVHESAAINDVTLKYTYTPPNGIKHTAQVYLTVTPVIQSFGTHPNADAGDPNGQNVIFGIGTDASGGLRAMTPLRQNGITFNATLLRTNLPSPGNSDPRFIQNVMTMENGVQGTKDSRGATVGWLWNDGTGELLVPAIGYSLPADDVIDNTSDPAYHTGSATNVTTPDGTQTTISDVDSPFTGFPIDNLSAQMVAIDGRWTFKLYLAWQWIQPINGIDRQVLYPIAYTNWQVVWYATPKTVIVVKNGVTSDGPNYTPSNKVPDCMDPKNNFNGHGMWVYPA